MAAETTYQVNAVLTLKGKFEQQMRRASRSIDPVQRKMNRLARTMSKIGKFMGSGAKVPGAGLFGPLAAAGGAGLVATMGAAVTSGFRFNKLMEDTSMSIGTMFSLFNVGQSTLKANATEAESFARNMQMAEAAQAQLYKKQARTPAGFTQLLEMTQQAVPGLAQATNDVNRMTELMTELSLLGPALNNDFAARIRALEIGIDGC